MEITLDSPEGRNILNVFFFILIILETTRNHVFLDITKCYLQYYRHYLLRFIIKGICRSLMDQNLY